MTDLHASRWATTEGHAHKPFAGLRIASTPRQRPIHRVWRRVESIFALGEAGSRTMFGSTCALSTDPELWRQRSTRINIETCVVSQRRAPVCQCVASLPIARRQDGGRLCDFRCTRGWSCLVTVPGPSRPATQATAPKRRGQWLRKPDVRDLRKTARRNSSRCLVRGSHLPQRAALAPCSPSAVEPVGVPFANRASFGPCLTALLRFRFWRCRVVAVGVNYGTGPELLWPAQNPIRVKIQRHSRRVCPRSPRYCLLLAKLVALNLATKCVGKHFMRSAQTA